MDQQRTVKRSIFDHWIDQNGPDGLLELARKSKVSSSTITKARLGTVPRKQVTRDRLCKALGIQEDLVFPPLTRRKGMKAS